MITKKFKKYRFYFADDSSFSYADEVFSLLESPKKNYVINEIDFQSFSSENLVILSFLASGFTGIIQQNIFNQAKTIFLKASELIAKQIPISPPVAYGAEYKYGVKTKQFVVRKSIYGKTLREILNDNSIPEWEKNNAVYSVIDTYETAWSKGWVHGNVSLDNILFIEDKPYLTNILLARKLTTQALIRDKENFLACFEGHPLFGEIMIDLDLNR